MQLIIKQDDPFSEISQTITPEQKRAILAYIGALKSPLISCHKCDDTGSLSKSVYGDRDCHYCDRADESARVLAWYKSARTDGGDADTLNVYYHGVAAGADLQRARIAELEREVAANREKIAAAIESDLAAHRKLAGETLRADQGWQRYKAKNRECNALREQMAADNGGGKP